MVYLIPASLNSASPFVVPIQRFSLISMASALTISEGSCEFWCVKVVQMLLCSLTRPLFVPNQTAPPGVTAMALMKLF